MLAVVVIFKSWGNGADWPQFRGPDGQGHSVEKGIPIQWSEGENITWKTAGPGQGWSCLGNTHDRKVKNESVSMNQKILICHHKLRPYVNSI